MAPCQSYSIRILGDRAPDQYGPFRPSKLQAISPVSVQVRTVCTKRHCRLTLNMDQCSVMVFLDPCVHEGGWYSLHRDIRNKDGRTSSTCGYYEILTSFSHIA